MQRLGIDLGGTKIEAVLLDDSGQIRWRQRLDTPQGDYPATLEAIAQLVTAADAEAGQALPLGIGTPGAVSTRSGLMKNCNSTCLIGQPLQQDLARRLARPVRLANDADCFALSEASDGAAAGMPTVFGVILGTGVGGGLVVNGQPLSGPNAIAGEWGHNPLALAGLEASSAQRRPCYCGRENCIETFLSGEGLMRTHQLLGGDGANCTEIARRAEAGEPVAREALGQYAEQLARALAGVINIVDPHAIVLGGGLSNIEALYREVPARWGAYVFSDEVLTRLARARFGDSSGVRGAAWLWPALVS